MDIVTEASTVAGLPFRLKEILTALNTLWRHVQFIRSYPKKKAKLDERVHLLLGILSSLDTNPDDAISELILASLRSASELVQSVPNERSRSERLMGTAYSEKLDEAEKKLDLIVTQVTVLKTNAAVLASHYHTVDKLSLNPPRCEAGLGRSGHVLTFLRESEASKQPLRVIVIYGQAGIGKTTLLNTIWQGASSKRPFCARAYVQLGERLKPEDITNLQNSICEQLGERTAKFPAHGFGQAALDRLFKNMKGQNKPVFLAIDNVFEADHLTSLLPSKLAMEDVPDSSCIVVTCRNHSIGDAILRICHLREEDVAQVLFFEPRYLNSEESEALQHLQD